MKAWASVACFKRSGIATTEANDVSFRSETQLLVCGGIAMRMACGSTIFRSVRRKERPSADAASNCPFGTASMPERRTSAVKAAKTMERAIVAETKDENRNPTKG